MNEPAHAFSDDVDEGAPMDLTFLVDWTSSELELELEQELIAKMSGEAAGESEAAADVDRALQVAKSLVARAAPLGRELAARGELRAVGGLSLSLLRADGLASRVGLHDVLGNATYMLLDRDERVHVVAGPGHEDAAYALSPPSIEEHEATHKNMTARRAPAKARSRS